MHKIRKDDMVKVIAGKDKDKTGKVLHVDTKKNTVLVEGCNMVTKHTKPSQTNQTGGIVHKENPIDISNVMLLVDGKATREEPDDDDVYVCDACGSRKIEIQAWVDANNAEYLSDVDDDDTDCKWCADCEQS